MSTVMTVAVTDFRMRKVSKEGILGSLGHAAKLRTLAKFVRLAYASSVLPTLVSVLSCSLNGAEF